MLKTFSKRRNVREPNQKKGRSISRSRRPRREFETLEPRIALAVAQGIAANELAQIAAEFPGFELGNVAAERVYVVDANSISTASLRDAIAAAQASPGADAIVVRTSDAQNSALFSATDKAFAIQDASPLTIVAIGPKKLTLDAAGRSRIFDVAAGSNVRLGNLILTNGSAENGGAIRNAGTLSIATSFVRANVASGRGGGIYSSGSLELIGCVVDGNRSSGDGGGVSLVGTNRLRHSIVNCTITGNRSGAGDDAIGRGGGVYFSGLDLNSTTTSTLALNNSIVVENESSATEIDKNIYDAMFYNSFEIAGEIYEIETGAAALIDGANNLSTFVYWVSEYDPDAPAASASGTNRVYDESRPLFVRNYDFATETSGDYALQETFLSQAIDGGDSSLAVYANGAAIPFDLAGGPRVRDGRVDVGAYEFASTWVDLATRDGGTLSASAVVADGAITLSGIEIANLDDRASGELTLRFYASSDGTITSDDVLLGEQTLPSIPGGATRIVDSELILTAPLPSGTAWRIGWTLESATDNVASNDVGVCATPLSILATASTLKTLELESANYTVRQGGSFRLASADDSFSSSTRYDYWADFGNGYFVKSSADGWATWGDYPPTPGEYSLRLRVVDRSTQTVTGEASATLTVVAETPCVSIDFVPLLDGRALRLDVDAFYYGGRTVANWRVDWGDGSTPTTLAVLSNSLSVAHYFSTSAASRNVKLTLTDDDGSIVAFNVASPVVGTKSVAESASSPKSNAICPSVPQSSPLLPRAAAFASIFAEDDEDAFAPFFVDADDDSNIFDAAFPLESLTE